MIGVVVDLNERDVVTEFFELFKTPWEFYRSDGRYDVVLCRSDHLCGHAPQLLVIFGGEETPFDTEIEREVQSQIGGFVFSEEGERLPIYGHLATFRGNPNSVLKEETTHQPAAFASRRGSTTVLRVGYDLFEEVRIILTVGQPATNAGIPALEEHITWLRNWIVLAGIPSMEIPPVPDGHNFIGCLTHDIDHPALRKHWCDHTMFGFLYRSIVGTCLNVCRGRKPVRNLWKNWGSACLLPFVHLGFAKDFWGDFDRYLEIEAGYGSTFFVIPRMNYPGRTVDGFGPPMRACRYNVDEILPQLKRIAAAGCEVGVHGLDAWIDASEGREERETVSRVIGATAVGVRMHWLFFDKNSPAVLDRAGFAYDTTVGYRETVGYRAGTAQVYKPLGATKLLELPLHVMDTALFFPSYLNLDEDAAQRLVWKLIDDVERFGGALTINWHDRSIAPERLWDNFYLRLLRELKNRGAWLPTAAQAVAWFRKRRSANLESVRVEQGVVRLRGRLPVEDELPGLKVRVYKPRGRSTTNPVAPQAPAEFVDVPLNRTTELNITI